MPVTILDWKAIERNTLRGFAKVKLGALVIFDVALHTKNGTSWAQLPAKPQITREGTVRTNADGKAQYTPILEWDNRDSANRFSASVVAAINEAHPGAIE